MVAVAKKNHEVVANLVMRCMGDVLLRQKFLMEDTIAGAIKSIDPDGDLLTSGEAEEAKRIIIKHIMG